MKYIKTFSKNKSGSIAVIGVFLIAFSLCFGAVLIDYALMSKKKGELQSALDATTTWAANHIALLMQDHMQIKSKEISSYAYEQFKMNLPLDKKEAVDFQLTLPTPSRPLLKIRGSIFYNPIFFNFFDFFSSGKIKKQYKISATSHARLADKLEIALVLDVSGSMSYEGSFTNKKRIDLLKEAAKEFLDTMEQSMSPAVKVAIVPFSTFVNVGPEHAAEKHKDHWLDFYGKSPKHFSYFDFHPNSDGIVLLDPMQPELRLKKKRNGSFIKDGSAWPLKERGDLITRFTILDSMKYDEKGVEKRMKWKGCVEAPLYPYSISDSFNPSDPKSLFVPVFFPDHPFFNNPKSLGIDYWPDTYQKSPIYASEKMEAAIFKKEKNIRDIMQEKEYIFNYGQYFPNGIFQFYAKLNESNLVMNDARKYFIKREGGTRGTMRERHGPNIDCQNSVIVPLKNISNKEELSKLKNSINLLDASGSSTNITEGLVWGWRVLSSKPPFTEGEPYKSPGNVKIIILLTDGTNTFADNNEREIFNKFTKDELEYYKKLYSKHEDYWYQDRHFNQNDFHLLESYNAYGYGYYNLDEMRKSFKSRLQDKRPNFHETSVFPGFSEEMNNQTYEVCDLIKKNKIKIITIALDVWRKSFLHSKPKKIKLLEDCASEFVDFRFIEEKQSGRKMFWDSTGKELVSTFKKVANILSAFHFVK